jgi:hypothetical protein
MTKQQREEAEAWLTIAEEYAAHRACSFLCFAVNNTGFRPNPRIAALPIVLRNRMKAFIRAMLGGQTFAYDNVGGVDRESRLMALLLFAEMAKDGATDVG